MVVRSIVTSDRWANEVLEDSRRCLLVKKQEINIKNTLVVWSTAARDGAVKDRLGSGAQHCRKRQVGKRGAGGW